MATWIYYRNSQDRRVVAEEILAFHLDDRGLLKWNALLTAVATGVAQAGTDYKVLQGAGNKGLREVIFKYDGNAYRLIYCVQSGGDSVLLAVRAFSKKSEKTPPAHLKVARDRSKDWQTRYAR